MPTEETLLLQPRVDPPRLFLRVNAYLADSLASKLEPNELEDLTTNILTLEETLRQKLLSRHITTHQVNKIKEHLLSALVITYQQINCTNGNQRTTNRDLHELLRHAKQQKTILDRLFYYNHETPESYDGSYCRVLFWMRNMFATLFFTIFIPSVNVFLEFINYCFNKKIPSLDVIFWYDILSFVSCLNMILIEFVIPGLEKVYENCTNPQNSLTQSSAAVARSIFGIFQQYQHYTLDDFSKNNTLLPRKIRDIAVKLYFVYLMNGELLSVQDIQNILNEYARYLSDNNQLFKDKVEGIFVDSLLAHKINFEGMKVSSIIDASDVMSEEQALRAAIEAVKEALEAQVTNTENAVLVTDATPIQIVIN